MTRRRHSKITDLPESAKAAVDDLLASGARYEQIAAYLAERGHPVGKSSVGRYAKDVAEAARELTVITEQLKPVLERVGENPNLELGSVATQMGLMTVIRLLKATEIGGGDAGSEDDRAKALAAVCRAAAQLQRSQAAAEKYRMQWREQKAAADAELDKLGTSQGITGEVVEQIKALYSL